MKIQIKWTVVAGVAVVAALLLMWAGEEYFRKPHEAQNTTAIPSRANPGSSRVAEQMPDGRFMISEMAETARELNAPDATPDHDLAVLQNLLEFYRRTNDGGVPEGGNNEEIVRQMLGHNVRRFAVLPPGLSCINAAGQLLDRWNTPYFFHPVSSELIEIRSAGPDRKMWTNDDVTLSSGESDQSSLGFPPSSRVQNILQTPDKSVPFVVAGFLTLSFPMPPPPRRTMKTTTPTNTRQARNSARLRKTTNSGRAAKTLSITVPGQANKTVTNRVTGATVTASNSGSDRVFSLASEPMELNAFLVK